MQSNLLFVLICLLLPPTHSALKLNSLPAMPTRQRNTKADSASAESLKSASKLRGGGGPPLASLGGPPLASLVGSTKRFVAVNILGAAVSLATGSHVHIDLLGTGAFAYASQAKSSTFNAISKASGLCVGLWSIKLASFLFGRALIMKHDARLDDTLGKIDGVVGFWSVSTLWGIFCLMPHSLGAINPAKKVSYLPVISKIGLSMFAFGFAIETMADYQKIVFKSANKGGFANTGLWAISQHPNYFGNLLVWSGITLMNVPNLINPGRSFLQRYWRLGTAVLSPIFLLGLFYGQATGNILDSVSLADAKYGHLKDYQTYKETVPLIFPKFM